MNDAPPPSLAREIGVLDDEGNIVLDGVAPAALSSKAQFSLAAELGLDAGKSIAVDVVWPQSARRVDCLPFIDITEAAASPVVLAAPAAAAAAAATAAATAPAAVGATPVAAAEAPTSPKSTSPRARIELSVDPLNSNNNSSAARPIARALFGAQSTPSPALAAHQLPSIDDWLLSDGPPDFRPASHRATPPTRKRGPQHDLTDLLAATKAKAARWEQNLQRALQDDAAAL